MGTTWPSQTWQLPWVSLKDNDSQAAGMAAHSTAALPSLTKGPHSSTLRFLSTAGLFFLLLVLTQQKVPLKRGLADVFWSVLLSGSVNHWQETAQAPSGFGEPCATYMENNQILLHMGTRKPCHKCHKVKLLKDSTVQNHTIVSSCPQHHTLLPFLSCQHQCSGSTTANHYQGTELKWVKSIPFCNVDAFHGAAPIQAPEWPPAHSEQPVAVITLSRFVSYSGYCGTKYQINS